MYPVLVDFLLQTINLLFYDDDHHHNLDRHNKKERGLLTALVFTHWNGPEFQWQQPSYWQVGQISWLDKDADHMIVIVLNATLIWTLGFLSTGTTGHTEVRPCVTERQCVDHVIPCWPCDLDLWKTLALLQLGTSLRPTSLDFCRHAGFDYSNRLIRLHQALT